MSYEKQTWKTGDIITSEGLNHIEDGIEGVETEMAPVTTYTESNSKTYSCNYANNNFGGKGKILWENPNPNSSVAEGTTATLSSDDYDYLICLCDKFFEGLSIVPISNRIKGIIKRYQLGKVQEECLFKQSMKLKEYFDKKTGHDIYEILGIKD